MRTELQVKRKTPRRAPESTDRLGDGPGNDVIHELLTRGRCPVKNMLMILKVVPEENDESTTGFPSNREWAMYPGC